MFVLLNTTLIGVQCFSAEVAFLSRISIFYVYHYLILCGALEGTVRQCYQSRVYLSSWYKFSFVLVLQHMFIHLALCISCVSTKYAGDSPSLLSEPCFPLDFFFNLQNLPSSSSSLVAVMSEYHKMDPNKSLNIFGYQIIYQTNIWIYSDATYLPKYIRLYSYSGNDTNNIRGPFY